MLGLPRTAITFEEVEPIPSSSFLGTSMRNVRCPLIVQWQDHGCPAKLRSGAAGLTGAVAVDDAALGEIVGRHLDVDPIARQHLDAVTP